MSVIYSQDVGTVRPYGFLFLLFRWKGSIFKLMFPEFIFFVFLYATLTLIFVFGLAEEEQIYFQYLSKYCFDSTKKIPLSFVIGFFVTAIMKRYFQQFSVIPWPQRLALVVSAYVRGEDDLGRMYRRTIMRYCIATLVQTLCRVSVTVKKRFPTYGHFVEAGLLLENEVQFLEKHPLIQTTRPMLWAIGQTKNALKDQRIRSQVFADKIISEINDLRGQCGQLIAIDWVNVPLAYMQIVLIAVYLWMITLIFGRFADESNSIIEKYVPLLTLIQFFFYIGWIKVAQLCLNPYGDEDTDFDVHLLVDRYIHESYLMVDDLFRSLPNVFVDHHWNEKE